MRITIGQFVIIILLTGFSYARDSHAQAVLERSVTLDIEELTLKHALSQIEKAVDVKFVYSKENISAQRKVSLLVNNQKLASVLDELLTPLQIQYEVVEQQIVLKKKRAGIQDKHTSLPPESIKAAISISGKVTTQDTGENAPGVNVLLKGTTIGTTTNAEGEYLLSIPDGNENGTLVFSFIGYATEEVAISNQTIINISLVPDIKSLGEVVVIGYGTQKKENLTGAVSTIDSKRIENRPVSNLANALQGTTPGLTVTRTGGQPGNENINIQVRGATSANGNVNPLLMVDGIPAPIFTLQTLNPNDIESVTVLKDASAAAIYGAQAAGGVIVVTTKKGAAGKTKFEYSNQIGLDWTMNVPQRLSLLEEAEFVNLSRANRGLAPDFTEADLENIRNGVEYTINPADTTRYLFFNQKSHIDQVLRKTTPMQTHNFSASGGNEKLNFLLSLGYYDKQGVFKVGPDRLRRYNARLNIGAQLTKHISLDSRIAYSLHKQEQPSADTDGNLGLLSGVYQARTRFPIFTPEGRLNGDAGSSGMNAYALLKEGGYNNFDRNFFDGAFTLKAADFIKGFSARAIYGAQYRRGDRERFFRTVELWRRFSPGFYLNNPNSFEVTKEVELNNNLQFLLDYDLNLGERNHFHFLAGYQWEDSRFSSLFSRANSLVNNDLPTLNLGDDRTKANSETIRTYAYQSYFGRLNYSFGDKYLFEATVRVDESSRLAPGLRSKAFPAASIGWNVHRENWFASNLPFFSELKIRASWGQLGSALANNIGLYDYLSLLSNNSNVTLGTPEARSPYFFESVVPSSSLTWETVETSNIGTNLGFFENKLQLAADYYIKYNRNMLTPLQLPATFGVGTPRINNGVLRSWGWELDMQYSDRIKENFTYSVGFNLSDNQNELIEYAGRKVINAGTVGILEGQPLNTIWGYNTSGYFQSEDEVTGAPFQDSRTGTGDVRYVDMDGDNRITIGKGTAEEPGDLVLLGTDQPRFLFGFNGSIQWKSFDFSVFFQGVGKRAFQPSRFIVAPLAEGWLQPLAVHSDYWTPENRDAAFPRPYLQGSHNFVASDKWVLNGQYVRLKNIQLGYSLPEKLISKVKLSRARIFVTGQDILTFTRLGIFDGLFNPENQNGVYSNYPFFATAAMGVNITF